MKIAFYQKEIAFTFSLLLLGVTIVPSINFTVVKASDDNESVVVTTQTCDINGPHVGGHFVGILVLLGSCYSAERNPSNITFQGKSILVFGFAYWDEEGTIAMLSPSVGALNATIYTSQFHGVCSAHLICGMILGSWEENDLYG